MIFFSLRISMFFNDFSRLNFFCSCVVFLNAFELPFWGFGSSLCFPKAIAVGPWTRGFGVSGPTHIGVCFCFFLINTCISSTWSVVGQLCGCRSADCNGICGFSPALHCSKVNCILSSSSRNLEISIFFKELVARKFLCSFSDVTFPWFFMFLEISCCYLCLWRSHAILQSLLAASRVETSISPRGSIELSQTVDGYTCPTLLFPLLVEILKIMCHLSILKS